MKRWMIFGIIFLLGAALPAQTPDAKEIVRKADEKMRGLVQQTSMVNDFSHKLLGTETIEGRICHKIDLVPKEDAAVVWGKIIVWIDNVVNYYPGCVQVHQKGYWNEQSIDKAFYPPAGLEALDLRIVPRLESFALASHENYTTGVMAAGVAPRPGRRHDRSWRSNYQRSLF